MTAKNNKFRLNIIIQGLSILLAQFELSSCKKVELFPGVFW